MVWDGDLLDSVSEEVAKKIGNVLGKPVVETRWTESVSSSDVVGSTVCSDGACFAASGEARDERPDEHRNVKCSMPFDDLALAGEVVDKLRWKERSQPPSYNIWGEIWFHNFSPCGLQQ